MATRSSVARVLLGGVVSGLVAGIALQLALLATSTASGQPLWPVLKGAATPLLGARATGPAPDEFAVAAGLACHYAVSIGWGVLFALLVDGLSPSATVLTGIAFGFAVWLGMAFIVLPGVGLATMGRAMATMPISAATHALFGLVLGLVYLGFQRRRAITARRVWPVASTADGDWTGGNKPVVP